MAGRVFVSDLTYGQHEYVWFTTPNGQTRALNLRTGRISKAFFHADEVGNGRAKVADLREV
jgi:hypothetical protein